MGQHSSKKPRVTKKVSLFDKPLIQPPNQQQMQEQEKEQKQKQGNTPEVEPVPKGFKWIDGRGFSEKGSPVYLLPNDGSESQRLNRQHYQIRNYHVPLKEELTKGIKVLDVG
ncbi:hypothetical protein BC938DRAFT_484313 [Jimgerdemannia flammicorona]|uniref:Uncharacterized protein n=1 Tax=Jimgerdemannia flammicorona TaxID=994334 RepID=A0A433QA28_9FUNG|nr:hypothetical protein BC938DRAFT_484313 [Jimgerdemannia flammicorona]